MIYEIVRLQNKFKDLKGLLFFCSFVLLSRILENLKSDTYIHTQRKKETIDTELLMTRIPSLEHAI